jgi:hypothetical protein
MPRKGSSNLAFLLIKELKPEVWAKLKGAERKAN